MIIWTRQTIIIRIVFIIFASILTPLISTITVPSFFVSAFLPSSFIPLSPSLITRKYQQCVHYNQHQHQYQDQIKNQCYTKYYPLLQSRLHQSLPLQRSSFYPFSLSLSLSSFPFRSSGNDSNENENFNEADDEISTTIKISPPPPIPSVELPEKNESIKKNQNKEQQQQRKKGLLLVDAFSPCHGLYLSSMALQNNVGIVSVLSNTVASNMYVMRGFDKALLDRMPTSLVVNYDDGYENEDEEEERVIMDVENNEDEETIKRKRTLTFKNNPDSTNLLSPSDLQTMKITTENWLNLIPFDIVGIHCESEIGLDDTEMLAKFLGLSPTRANILNSKRRDKYEVNELCSIWKRKYHRKERRWDVEEEGLEDDYEKEVGMDVVKQKMCSDIESALRFAKELGVPEKLAKISTTMEDTNNNDESTICENNSSNSNHDGHDDDTNSFSDRPNTGLLGRFSTMSANPPKFQSSLLPSPRCIIKPPRGVGSTDVYLCHDLQSIPSIFQTVSNASQFGAGGASNGECVLVQEYLEGIEYAVDIVSRNGYHRVAALWKYDKREVNGASFVYHATELVDGDDDYYYNNEDDDSNFNGNSDDDGVGIGSEVSRYAMDALDAIDVRWGMSHVEVIVTPEYHPQSPPSLSSSSPSLPRQRRRTRLVEVNCRQHNADFAPLASSLIGYNAFDLLLSAYLDSDDNNDDDANNNNNHSENEDDTWDNAPILPVTHSYGAIVHLVCHSSGILSNINVNVLNEMEQLSSVRRFELYPSFTEIGSIISPTLDIRTDCGFAHILNDNGNEFRMDYDRLVELMPFMFEVE